MKKIIPTIVSLIIVTLASLQQALAQNRIQLDERRLTSSLITRVCQDTEGYIWIGTEYGLNRFDGHNFRKYFPDESDPTSLLSNNVRNFYIDTDSTLWIGTNVGLQKYIASTDNFKTIPFDDDMTTSITQVLRMPDNGDLWVVTTGHGVYTLDEKSGTLSPQQIDNIPFESEGIRHLYIDNYGNLWVTTANEGLWCHNKANDKWRLMKDGKQVGFIQEDGSNRLFIIQRGDVYLLDERENEFVPISWQKGLDVRSLTLLSNGDLLITTYSKGIYTIEKSSTEIKPYLDGESNCVSLIEDRDGNLWIGCTRRGITLIPQINGQFGFTPMSAPVSSVMKHGENLWVGCENSTLYKMGSNGRIEDAIELKSSPVSLFCLPNGNILVGTYYNGVATLNPESHAVSYCETLDGQRAKSIVANSSGTLYVATFNNAVSIFDPTTGKAEKLDVAFKDKYFNVLMVDRQDRLWIGHYKGVDIYNTRTGQLQQIPSVEDSISAFATNALLQDTKGRIWIGTNHGLWRYNSTDNSIKVFNTANGLSNDIVCGVEEDTEGNIWASTFNGINKIDASDIPVVFYATGEKEFTRGAYISQGDPSYEVVFGGNRGLTITDSRRKPATLDGKNVIITNIRPKEDNLYVIDQTGAFTLDFSIMDFTASEGLCYAFSIDGKSWATTSPGINSVTFSGLGYGKHKLQVKAIENGLETKTSTFIISIPAPWYLSWWMKAIYGLIILAACYLLYLLWLHRRQADENEQRMRFFINIAHDLRSPLTLIASPIEKMMSKSETYDDETNRSLRTISRSANKILSMLNQLLDIRRIDKGQMTVNKATMDLIALLDDIKETFMPQAEKHRIAFELKHEGIDHLYIYADAQSVDRVVVNLLSNAFKFTPDGGAITLTVRQEGTNAVITVEDTGEGINENEQKKIFERFYQGNNHRRAMAGFGIGLNLCKLLVELHQGNISAERVSKDGGSRLTVVLPINAEQISDTPLIDEKQPVAHPFLISEPTEEERKARKASAARHPYRVLIVDDDDDLREFLITEMGDNFRTSGCRNGLEALSMATAQIPDLIVTDVVMPEMDGFTLLKRLKANSATSHIPVIMLTTKADRPERMKGLEQGADAYLAKPFMLDELIALASNLIAGRQLLKGKYTGLHDQEATVTTVNKSSDELLMERLMKVINEHLSDSEMNMDMLASEVGLSRVQLHRRLRDMMGMSTGDFVRNIRFKQAAKLLLENKLSISEVAYSVGFSNTAHFSTAFKKQYGMSPTQYRQQGDKQGDDTETKADET